MFSQEDIYLVTLMLIIGSSALLFITRIYHRFHIRTIIQPVEVTIEHHVYRIPIEDRVDMDIEDRHNVHNMCLKRNAFNIIQNLRASDQHKYTTNTALNAIHRLIEFSIDDNLDKLERAEVALDLIEEIGATYSSGHVQETELIRLIWERIQHPMNEIKREQLEDNLIEQLADCKNGSHGVHCCEGRIMRLLQTLEGCDNHEIVNLRPMWAFKEEIVNKILKYREKLLTKLPPQYASLDQKPDLTQKEQDMLSSFNQCLIKNLDKRFEIDYISQGLLSPDELTSITDPYYESL